MAVRTTLTAGDLPDSLARCAAASRRRCRTAASALQGRLEGWRAERGGAACSRQRAGRAACKALEDKHPAIRKAQSVTHLGTLGGGNHFIEVCLDEERPRLGHAALGLARHRQPHRHATSSQAREALDTAPAHAALPDRDLAWLRGRRAAVRRLRRGGRLGAGVRAPQPRADDGGGAARACASSCRRSRCDEAGGQLPPQLRRARAPLRRATCG